MQRWKYLPPVMLEASKGEAEASGGWDSIIDVFILCVAGKLPAIEANIWSIKSRG